MTNIVVGAEVVERGDVKNIVTKRFVGQDAPIGQENPNADNAIQLTNKDYTDINGNIADGNSKNNGLISVSVDKITNSSGGSDTETTFAGMEDKQTTPSRFFGSYYLNSDNKETVNSFQAPINDANGKELTLNGVDTDKDGKFELKAEKIKLQNVQYGRVTANIEPLDEAAVAALNVANGESYYEAKFRNKGQKDATDVYFFRGLNETKTLPASGKFEYAGHALMYGIDNSYHGSAGPKGQSNSFVRGAEANGLGNFVQATVDFERKTVGGQVYNLWLPNRSESKAIHDTLVNFNGQINDKNAVHGTATLAYPTKEDKTASFHAAFYGTGAEELGGSFNSVTDGQKFGNITDSKGWGGVFGAKQLEKTKAVITPDNSNGAIAQ